MDVLFNDDARDYGFTGFQHIFSAFLTVFQCSTMEGWTDIMYRYQNSSSQVFAMVFFVVVMVLGSTFFVNLSVAILWEKYPPLPLLLTSGRGGGPRGNVWLVLAFLVKDFQDHYHLFF